MKKPPPEQFDIAIHWLENNEGDGSEGEACKAVAAWLDAQEDARQMRNLARSHGVPVKALREHLES